MVILGYEKGGDTMGKSVKRLTLCLILVLLQGCVEPRDLSRVIKIETVEDDVTQLNQAPMDWEMAEDHTVATQMPIYVGLILDTMDERHDEWTYFIEASLSAANEDVHLLTKKITNETTQDNVVLMTELIKEGSQIIVIPNNRDDQEIQAFAEHYPNVIFILLDSDLQGENIISVKIQHEVASYLAGVMAGAQTQSNEVAYVAYPQTTEHDRGYEAFVDGVETVNKTAQIHYILCESSDEPDVLEDEIKALIKQKVDIIYEQTGEMSVTIESTLTQENASAFLIQNQFKMTEAITLSHHTMATITYHLDPFIAHLTNQVTEHVLKGEQYLLGLENKGISVSFNESVMSHELIDVIEKSIDKLIKGDIVHYVEEEL